MAQEFLGDVTFIFESAHVGLRAKHCSLCIVDTWPIHRALRAVYDESTTFKDSLRRTRMIVSELGLDLRNNR